MKKIISLLLVFLIVGIGLVSAHGESGANYDGHHEGMMSGFYGGFGMGLFGWTFMILIIIVLILLIIWLINQVRNNRSRK